MAEADCEAILNASEGQWEGAPWANKSGLRPGQLASLGMVIGGSVVFLLVLPCVLFRCRRFPLSTTSAALLGACLMVVAGVLTQMEVYQIVGEVENLRTVFLLLGMMILAQYFEREQMLEALLTKALTPTLPLPVFLAAVGLISALGSALFTNDVACVVLTPVLVQVWRSQRRPPSELQAMLMVLATTSNIGSAVTIFGNPQMALIASKTESLLYEYSALTLERCLMYLGPPALLAFFINLTVILVWHHLRKVQLRALLPTLCPKPVRCHRCRRHRRHRRRREPQEELEMAPGEVENITAHGVRPLQLFHPTPANPPAHRPSTLPVMADGQRVNGRAGRPPSPPPTISVHPRPRSASPRPSHPFRFGGACAHALVPTHTHQHGASPLPHHRHYHGAAAAAAASAGARRVGSWQDEDVLSPIPESPSLEGAEEEWARYRTWDMLEDTEEEEDRIDPADRAAPPDETAVLMDDPALLLSERLGLYRSLTAITPVSPAVLGELPPEEAEENHSTPSDPDSAPSNRMLFRVFLCFIMLAVVALLFFRTPKLSFDMGLVPLMASAVVMLVDAAFNRRGAGAVLRRVDWGVLLMFFAIFVWMRGVNATQLPSYLWHKLGLEEGGDVNTPTGILTLVGFVVVGSNIFSNVPLTLLVLDRLQPCRNQLGLVLILAFVSTVAGNLTLIGSVANLIVAERAFQVTGLHRLSFLLHLQVGLPSTLLVLAACVPLLVSLLNVAS